MMLRLNLLLLVLLVICAVGVVTSQHRARKLFTELDGQQEAARKIDQEWRELQLENQTLATSGRIEQKATQALGMHSPEAGKAIIVLLDGEAPSLGAVKP
jgi:cell division protein FtsL